MPTFDIGDRAVLFVSGARAVSPIVGHMQGRFPINTAPDGTHYVTLHDRRAFSAVSQIGVPVTVSPVAIPTMTLEAFQAGIAGVLQDPGGRGQAAPLSADGLAAPSDLGTDATQPRGAWSTGPGSGQSVNTRTCRPARPRRSRRCVPQDDVEARRWYNLADAWSAESTDDLRAQIVLAHRAIAERMMPADLSEAQRRSLVRHPSPRRGWRCPRAVRPRGEVRRWPWRAAG